MPALLATADGRVTSRAGPNSVERTSCSSGPRASCALGKGACECADMSAQDARRQERPGARRRATAYRLWDPRRQLRIEATARLSEPEEPRAVRREPTPPCVDRRMEAWDTRLQQFRPTLGPIPGIMCLRDVA